MNDSLVEARLRLSAAVISHPSKSLSISWFQMDPRGRPLPSQSAGLWFPRKDTATPFDFRISLTSDWF